MGTFADLPASIAGARAGFLKANGLRFHYVEAGAGPGRPLVLLLHGFPEFWYGWRGQIAALAQAGFHVVAPDQRGYNLSDKPPCVRDYQVEQLAEDVAAIADAFGQKRFAVVGHDWGGVVAWHAASRYPHRVSRLVNLNAPHPAMYLRELRRPRQFRRSLYAFFFGLPWLPEALIRFDDFGLVGKLFEQEPRGGAGFSRQEVQHYIDALARPRALHSALNWYRAAIWCKGRQSARSLRPVTMPTLVLWGERDRYLLPELTVGLERWATDLRIERFPQATHWIQHDLSDEISSRLTRFLCA